MSAVPSRPVPSFPGAEGGLPGEGPTLTGSAPQLAAMEPAVEILVDSPDVVYSAEAIEARYEYRTTRVSREGGVLRVRAGRGGAGGGGAAATESPRSRDSLPTRP